MLKANNYQRSGNMKRTRENNPRKYGEPLLQKKDRVPKELNTGQSSCRKLYAHNVVKQ